MKYKLKFKALDEKLTVEDLTTDKLLELVKGVWDKNFKRQFDRERSFVETEHKLDVKESHWDYWFWIGQLHLSYYAYDEWGRTLLNEFRTQLQKYLESKGLVNLRITEESFTSDGDEHNGNGFAVFKIENISVRNKFIYDQILKYFKEYKQFRADGIEGKQNYIEHWGGDGRLFRVYINLQDKLVAQVNYSASPSYVIPFTNRDLKLFDGLGFELSEMHKAGTRQFIDDWFDHKAQDVGMITKERFIDAFESLGFEEDNSHEGKKEKYSDHTTWAVGKNVGSLRLIVRYYEGDGWEKYQGTAAGLYYKPDEEDGDCKFTKLPNNVLRVLDNLGIEMHKHFVERTDQRSDDWFKALDGIDLKSWQKEDSPEFKNLSAYFDKFMTEEGYVHEIRSGSKSARYYQHKEKDVKFLIWMSANVVLKSKINDTFSYIPFTDRELKFFDNLGYKIADQQTKATGQLIDDWFNKANDSLDEPKAIADFLFKLQYVDRTDSVDADEILRFVRTENAKDESDADTGTHITVYPKAKTIIKEDCEDVRGDMLTCEFTSFTNEELQFFDNLGYDIDSAQKQYIKQNIDDWFWNMGQKANDIDIQEAVKDFYTKNYLGGEFTEYLHTLVISHKYKNEYIETLFDFTLMAIERFSYDNKGNRKNYKLFDAEELRFLDSLGFEFGSEYKTYTHQKIDDWFELLSKKKAEDIDVVKTIEEFYKMNYPLWMFWVGEGNSQMIYLEQKLKNRDQVIETNIDLRLKTIERFSRNTTTGHRGDHIKFNKDELRLFDNLGFTLDAYFAENVTQEMDDWFK